jgi:hypothetical protein
VLNEHTIVGGKGFGSRQGCEKVGNARIMVGRDLSASVRDVTMSPSPSNLDAVAKHIPDWIALQL